MRTNDLEWVERDLRDERKAAAQLPNENQMALAELLDSIGTWQNFITMTFRPNQHEMMGQTKDGEYTINERVQMCSGKKIVKRVGRDGQMRMGVPSVSPGWGTQAATRAGIEFLSDKRRFKGVRWFMCTEDHKHRDCAHLHALLGSSLEVNLEKCNREWSDKYGRFQVQVVNDDKGMGHYLGKQYVGKAYGREGFDYRFSRNCRTPMVDPFPRALYNWRNYLFQESQRQGLDSLPHRERVSLKQMVAQFKGGS